MMNESITSPLLDSIAALRTGIASSQDRICRGLVRRTAALPPLPPPAPWADHASLFSTILDYLDAELLALRTEINDADMHLYVAEEFLLDLQRSDKGGTDEPSDQDLEDAKTRLLGARHRMNETYAHGDWVVSWVTCALDGLSGLAGEGTFARPERFSLGGSQKLHAIATHD